MKKLFSLFTLFISIFALAQSTDLDRHDFNYSYVQLPSNPVVEVKNRTYSFTTNIDRNLMYDKSKFFFQNQVNINGLEKKEKNGYITIDITLLTPTVTKKNIATRTSSSKDKRGNVTNRYYYTAELTYDQKGSARVSSTDGKIQKTIDFTRTNTLKSKEYDSYSSAESYYYNINRTIYNNFVTEVVNTLNNQLNNEYGYSVKTGTDYLWILANKKHPEQAAEYDAYVGVKNVFDKMTFNNPVSGYEIELQNVIQYFESLPKKYAEDSKAHRKIRYSAYYNLAKIYNYLDLPAKSIEWSNKLIANDYDKSDGVSNIEECNNLITLFGVNKVNTRHFAVETKNFFYEEAVPTSTSSSYSTSSAPYSIETDPNYILAYLATIKKDTIAGYVPKNRTLALSDAITVTVKDFQGKFSERTFKANEINRLTLSNGEEFATVSFKVAVDNGGITMSGATKKFVKEMYVGKKMGVYQYFNGEIIVKGANESEGKSNATASWMMSPKKRFEELAQGCPALLSRVEKKEFKNNLESIIQFAEALDTCN